MTNQEQEIRNQVQALSTIYDLLGEAKQEAAQIGSKELRNDLLQKQDDVYIELVIVQKQLAEVRYDNVKQMAVEIYQGIGWISESYVEETYSNMFNMEVLEYELDEIKYQLHYTHGITIKG